MAFRGRYIRQKSRSNGRGGRRISWHCHEISSRISGRPDPASKFPSGSAGRIYVRIPWSLCDLALILAVASRRWRDENEQNPCHDGEHRRPTHRRSGASLLRRAATYGAGHITAMGAPLRPAETFRRDQELRVVCHCARYPCCGWRLTRHVTPRAIGLQFDTAHLKGS